MSCLRNFVWLNSVIDTSELPLSPTTPGTKLTLLPGVWFDPDKQTTLG